MIDFLNNHLAKQSKMQPYFQAADHEDPTCVYSAVGQSDLMSQDCKELDSHLSLELGGFFLRKMNVHAFINSLDAQKVRDLFSLVGSLKYESEITHHLIFFP